MLMLPNKKQLKLQRKRLRTREKKLRKKKLRLKSNQVRQAKSLMLHHQSPMELQRHQNLLQHPRLAL